MWCVPQEGVARRYSGGGDVTGRGDISNFGREESEEGGGNSHSRGPFTPTAGGAPAHEIAI